MQLALDPIPLRTEILEVLRVIQDGVLHLVDVHREQFDLVFARCRIGQRNGRERVLAGETDGLRGDLPDGVRHTAAQEPVEQQGDEGDHQEGGDRDVDEVSVPGIVERLHLPLDAEDADRLALFVFDGDHRADMGAGGRFTRGTEDVFLFTLAVHHEFVFVGVLVAAGGPLIAGLIGLQPEVLVLCLKQELDLRTVFGERDHRVDESGIEVLRHDVKTPHGGLVLIGRHVFRIEVVHDVVGNQQMTGEAADAVSVVGIVLVKGTGELLVADHTGEETERQQDEDESGDELDYQFAT